MEFRQCLNLVGRDGTLRSIVYDTGFGENFIVDFPAVTVRTADGDLPLGWKMVYPHCLVSLQKGRLVVVKKTSPTRTVISNSLEK